MPHLYLLIQLIQLACSSFYRWMNCQLRPPQSVFTLFHFMLKSHGHVFTFNTTGSGRSATGDKMVLVKESCLIFRWGHTFCKWHIRASESVKGKSRLVDLTSRWLTSLLLDPSVRWSLDDSLFGIISVSLPVSFLRNNFIVNSCYLKMDQLNKIPFSLSSAASHICYSLRAGS